MDLGSDESTRPEERRHDNQLVGQAFEITRLHWFAVSADSSRHRR
jgi:hypothetical protein